MKKTIITFLLALVFPITASAQLESVKELTMKSEFFNHERQVLIYTPVGYQQFDQTYYDVIYVFDAQDRTMFDLVHCLLNIACKPDPDGGRSQSFIIVGICSPNLWDINYFRNHDYLPMPIHGNYGVIQGGLLLWQIARPEKVCKERADAIRDNTLSYIWTNAWHRPLPECIVCA